MTYLLDADTFIRAKNEHYGFDFCPAYWEWLILKNLEGVVYSIERVKDELLDVDDPLANWVTNEGAGLFLAPDQKVLASMQTVSQWATSQTYTQAAIDTFMRKADYYLVSHALAYRHTVVTHEVPSGSPNKIKIPDACIGVGVKPMHTFQMLRREKARFVLDGRKSA